MESALARHKGRLEAIADGRRLGILRQGPVELACLILVGKSNSLSIDDDVAEARREPVVGLFQSQKIVPCYV